MEHVYEYDSCAPELGRTVVVVRKWRRFWEERPVVERIKYRIHHEEFVEEFDNGEYRKCSYMTKWRLLNTDETDSNSRYDYSDSENIDPIILTTDTDPSWEEIQLFPNNH